MNGASQAAAGGRARQSLVSAAMMLFAVTGISAANAQNSQVTVRQEAGVYTVAATFDVPQRMSIAVAVLTDYEQIPRFMPEVRTSHVVERGDDYAIVEQDAVARFMMFSKSVHLVLEVTQDGGSIRFRDRYGKSFSRYEGIWRISERDGHTAITYELSATPSFDVPDFLLKHLLKRDATRMIERLQAEIAARAARPATSCS
jgi:ribosome-associated toxin RatA of RatAB toxin-antitoxin module